MTLNGKVTGNASSMASGLLAGLLTALGITLAGAALIAALVLNETIPENTIGYCVMALVLLSSVAGAMIAIGKIKRQRLLVSGASGTLYYGALLSMTALFFGGQYQGMGVTALLVIAGCGAVVLLGMRTPKTASPHRRKIRHR